MKIKVDENLPQSLTLALRSLGHDAMSVFEQGLAGRSDDDIWPIVRDEQRLLITQDVQFADSRRSLAQGSPGVVLVRALDTSMGQVVERVLGLFQSERVDSWSGCCVTVTLTKFRVRRPS